MTEMIEPVMLGEDEEQVLAQQLVAQAKAAGIDLVGPGGLLAGLTRQVLETALDEELTEHLGCPPGQRDAETGTDERNGTRSKTVLTEIGPVEIDVPRDRDGSFEPAIVKNRQRRLDGVEELVLSLTARGLTTGEVSAHFAEVYGASVSKDTVSRTTDKVVAETGERQTRPLDQVYPVIFIDALVVKVRDGQVTNKPFYVVIGVTTRGERDILGIWAGDGGEGAKLWLNVLTEIKNRGVSDVCIAVCDGLKGLPDAITTVWELAQVQTRVIHLIRNTFRCAARQDWDTMARDLKPICTAANTEHAELRTDELAEKWITKYPAAVKLWRSAWSELVPFLDYDGQIRKIICTTNTIESLNARYRRAVRARGHFPNDAAALKRLYLVTRSLDPTSRGRARRVIRWKAALNAFAITFEGRISPSSN